jgi:hypothetical protein
MPYEIWTADSIVQNNKVCQAGLPDGRYVPARPMVWWMLWPRLKAAWGVFTSRYDAVDWEN